jgi:hypothetical protein
MFNVFGTPEAVSPVRKEVEPSKYRSNKKYRTGSRATGG